MSVSGPTPTEQATKGTEGPGLAGTGVPSTNVDGTEGGVESALAPEQQAAVDMIAAVDKGGVPLDARRVNKVARDLGMEVSGRAKPEDTIRRIREAVARITPAPIVAPVVAEETKIVSGTLSPVQKLEQYIETAPKVNLGIRAVMNATGLSEAESRQALAALAEQGVLVKGKQQGYKLAEEIETAGKPVISKEASLPEQLQELQAAGYWPKRTNLLSKFFKPTSQTSITAARKHVSEGIEALSLVDQLNTLIRSGSGTPLTKSLTKRLMSPVSEQAPPLKAARLHIQRINAQKNLVSNLLKLKEAGIPAADTALNLLEEGEVTEELAAEIEAFVNRQLDQLGIEKETAAETESRENAAIRDDIERKAEAAQRAKRTPPTLLSVAERDLRQRGLTDEAVDIFSGVEDADRNAKLESIKRRQESERGEKRGSVSPAVDKVKAQSSSEAAIQQHQELRNRLDRLATKINKLNVAGYIPDDVAQEAINKIRQGANQKDLNYIVGRVAGAERAKTASKTEKLLKEAEARASGVQRSRRRDQRPSGGQGIDKSLVDKVVAEVTAGWTNAPKIVTVQSVNELPAEVADANPLAPGFYDSDTDTVYVVADNAVDEASVKGTVFHESLGHFGLAEEFGSELDNVLNDILSTNTAAKAEATKWLETYPEAYKGLAPEARTVRALEEVFAERAEAGTIKSPGLRAAFNKIAALVRSFLRKMGIVTSYSDNDIVQVLQQVQDRVVRGVKSAAPSVRQGIKEQARKTAPKYESQTPEEQEKEAKARLDKDDKTKTAQEVIKSFNGTTAYEKLVNLFQNDRRALKTREDDMAAAKVLRTVGELFNNVYSQIVTSSQKTAFTIAKHLDPHITEIDDKISEYAKANNIEIKDVLARLDAYMVALHERERRHVKFLREVPLTKDLNIKLGNRMVSAEDFRKKIYDELKKDQDLVSNGTAKNLRKQLEALVKNHTDKTADAALLDENSTKYAVAGKLAPSDYEAMVNKYKNDAALQGIITPIKAMQKEGIRLDQEAHFWSQPVSNYKEFYDFKHYVPLKGKPEYEATEDDDYLEPNRARKGSVFAKELVKEFGGRFSESENVILQAQSDAIRAAMRFGRKDAMKAMKNAIDQKLIKGKKILTIRFEDRENIDPKDFQQGNEFFYYAPNGDINVYRIFEQDIAESIRRTYDNTSAAFEAMAWVTSGIGKMHTRYNPSFAIYNFVRDTLFNAYTMGVEGDTSDVAKYINAISSKVMEIGIGPASKGARVSRLIAEGKIKDLEALAAKNPAYRDILDFIKYGGKSAYVQSFSAKAKKDEMLKDFNRGTLSRSKETFDKWVDSWSDSFEYVSRVAAFSVFRSNALAELKAKGENINDPKILDQINTAAAAKAKELTNFESVGKYGRKLGAFYMFFRPAATGAVRAIDSFKPAFEDVNKLIARLPEAIKNNPTALAKFKEDHARKKVAAKHAMMAVMGMGAAIYLMALTGAEDDDYGRNIVATDDMELWTRNIRIPMSYFGGDKDKKLQLPWGFGLGAFASAGAQIAATLVGNTKPQDTVANLVTLAFDSFLPLPVARFNPVEHPGAWLVESAAPAFARPFLEYTFNVDGLGRQIYRDRQNRYGDAYTGSDNVPEMYREAAIMLSDATNGEIDWSPGEINFFANSYMDGISRILHGSRGIALALAGEKEIDVKKDLLFVDGFLGTKSSVDAKKFEEVRQKMEKMDSMLKKFKSVGESSGDYTQLQRYLEREPMAPYLAQLYNRSVNRDLRNVRQQLNAAEAGKVKHADGSRLTVQERKDYVKQLKTHRDFLMKGITEQVEAYSGHKF